jgi:hypothetical protein
MTAKKLKVNPVEAKRFYIFSRRYDIFRDHPCRDTVLPVLEALRELDPQIWLDSYLVMRATRYIGRWGIRNDHENMRPAGTFFRSIGVI